MRLLLLIWTYDQLWIVPFNDNWFVVIIDWCLINILKLFLHAVSQRNVEYTVQVWLWFSCFSNWVLINTPFWWHHLIKFKVWILHFVLLATAINIFADDYSSRTLVIYFWCFSYVWIQLHIWVLRLLLGVMCRLDRIHQDLVLLSEDVLFANWCVDLT